MGNQAEKGNSIDIRVREVHAPLYIIVKEKIRELVEQGVFKPGSKLPRETELAEMLNVSRNTLREALRLAQNEGLVIQNHGVGTFVSRKGFIDQGLGVLESIDSLSKRQHWMCETHELEYEIIKASENLASILEIPRGSNVTRVARVKSSNGKRIAFLEDFFPSDLATLEEIKQEFRGSVLDFFITRRNPKIDYAWTDISAIYAGELCSKKLAIPHDAILFVAQETLFSNNGNPFEYSINYMLMDFFKFHIVRTLPSVRT